MESISIKTGTKEELIDITGEINAVIKKQNIKEGICLVYTPHTTAGITINENADRDVKSDIIKGLQHLNFERVSFRHMEGNSPAHLKSSIIGCSETVIIADGSLQLGTWQGIFFCEFDGPRARKIFVKIV